MNKMDKIFVWIAPLVFIVAGILILSFYYSQGTKTTQQNNGYVRVINCIISVPATQRDRTDIDNCYKAVESDLGIKLQRYNNNPN